MISYLEQHYADPIQIDQLASTFGYSKNHFMNIFKQHFHLTPRQYRNQQLKKET